MGGSVLLRVGVVGEPSRFRGVSCVAADVGGEVLFDSIADCNVPARLNGDGELVLSPFKIEFIPGLSALIVLLLVAELLGTGLIISLSPPLFSPSSFSRCCSSSSRVWILGSDGLARPFTPTLFSRAFEIKGGGVLLLSSSLAFFFSGSVLEEPLLSREWVEGG